MRRLLDELLSYPGVPRHWRTANLDAATAPFLAIEFRKNDLTLRFFTTLTSFGTPSRRDTAGTPNRVFFSRRRGN